MNDYLVTTRGDTVRGSIRSTDFFQVRKVLLTANGVTKKFRVKKLRELKCDNRRYIRLEKPLRPGQKGRAYRGRFIEPIVDSGEVKLYRFGAKPKQTVFLSSNERFPLWRLKSYTDDYPGGYPGFRKLRVHDTLVAFLERYNKFSALHPRSRSFAELNFHHKRIFNPQVSVQFRGFFPGYAFAGGEMNLTPAFTAAPRISVIVPGTFGDLFEVIPFAELGAKYYFMQYDRLLKQKRTFRNTGPYISATFMQPLTFNVVRVVRGEVGYKFVHWGGLYFEYLGGVMYAIENQEWAILLQWGVGYSF